MSASLWLLLGAGWAYYWLSVCLTAIYAPNSRPDDTQ